MTTRADFPERLATLMATKEISQIDLAARIGVTRAAMSRYLSGEREPRFATLLRIAEELEVHISELLVSGAIPAKEIVRLVARAEFTAEQRAALRRRLDDGEVL